MGKRVKWKMTRILLVVLCAIISLFSACVPMIKENPSEENQASVVTVISVEKILEGANSAYKVAFDDGTSKIFRFGEQSPMSIGTNGNWYFHGVDTGIFADVFQKDEQGLTFYPLDDGTYAVGCGNAKYLSEIKIPTEQNGVKVTMIAPEGFKNAKNLTKIKIPEEIVTIGEYAFTDCNNLQSVVISDTVKTLEQNAFSGCAKLTSVDFGKGLTELGNCAFMYCETLEKITLPDSLTAISDYAFYGCAELSSITFGKNVTEIGEFSFYDCDGIAEIEFPQTLQKIGECAFADAGKIKRVKLPEGFEELGKYAFSGCLKLEEIVLPKSISSIGLAAFNNTAYSNDERNWENGCIYVNSVLINVDASVTVTEIVIKEGTSLIGAYAFFNCASVSIVHIPQSVLYINEYVFYGCEKLSLINYKGSHADWEEVTIHEDNETLHSVTLTYGG